VTWCIGHLLEQAEPEHYDEALKSWSLDTLPIIPKEWVYVAKKKLQDQLNVVLELIGKSDIIVNAGDPDREGAYLVNEVLEFANISQ
ncbi:DNA topoisomerase III, partial [Vibrio parahaemolyticus]|nr:DNA topoisomerase III [Vibrio parahaemolyticus]MBE5165018.1 DNA topoisomerase III [Vibrio parahaemolyticus]